LKIKGRQGKDMLVKTLKAIGKLKLWIYLASSLANGKAMGE